MPRLLRPGVLSLVLLFVPVTGAAAEPRRLTLAETVALAVRQSPALAAAGAELRMAQAGIEAARGLDDFVLEARGDWTQFRRQSVPGSPVQEPAVDQAGVELSLTRPLPTGGALGLHLLGDYSLREHESGLPPNTLRSTSQAYAPSLQLRFTHPLLRGFGVDVARADRRRARTRTDLVAAQREALAAALLRNVITAYWDLAYATQELEIRRAAAASARDQLRRVEANIGVGKQPRSGSAEIEVAIAFRDEAVLLAEQALSDRAVELARLCGLTIELGGPMLLATDRPGGPARLPAATVLADALAANPQLEAVRAQGQAATVEIDVTENGMLPQLDLAVAGGPIGNARDTDGAYQQLTGLNSYVVTASLAFSLPIGRHAARGARDAARESLRKARLDEADIAGQVAAAVARGVAAVETARKRAEVLERSTEAAGVDLEAERARFEVGRSTNFDVLRRQDSVAALQLVVLRARVDHLKALAAIDAVTGELLTRHGVASR